MRFLVIFIFLISNTFANETPNIKNLIINNELKEYTNLTILDDQNNQLNLSNYKGNILLLNFWATWCAPCKDEMPSLDLLKSNKDLNNLKIFPVNVGQDNVKKAKKFFDDLNIKNLDLYFDENINLTKKFALRGIPTSILLNKNGKEFARVIGAIDFNEENFIESINNFVFNFKRNNLLFKRHFYMSDRSHYVFFKKFLINVN